MGFKSLLSPSTSASFATKKRRQRPTSSSSPPSSPRVDIVHGLARIINSRKYQPVVLLTMVMSVSLISLYKSQRSTNYFTTTMSPRKRKSNQPLLTLDHVFNVDQNSGTRQEEESIAKPSPRVPCPSETEPSSSSLRASVTNSDALQNDNNNDDDDAVLSQSLPMESVCSLIGTQSASGIWQSFGHRVLQAFVRHVLYVEDSIPLQPSLYDLAKGIRGRPNSMSGSQYGQFDSSMTNSPPLAWERILEHLDVLLSEHIPLDDDTMMNDESSMLVPPLRVLVLRSTDTDPSKSSLFWSNEKDSVATSWPDMLQLLIDQIVGPQRIEIITKYVDTNIDAVGAEYQLAIQEQLSGVLKEYHEEQLEHLELDHGMGDAGLLVQNPFPDVILYAVTTKLANPNGSPPEQADDQVVQDAYHQERCIVQDFVRSVIQPFVTVQDGSSATSSSLYCTMTADTSAILGETEDHSPLDSFVPPIVMLVDDSPLITSGQDVAVQWRFLKERTWQQVAYYYSLGFVSLPHVLNPHWFLLDDQDDPDSDIRQTVSMVATLGLAFLEYTVDACVRQQDDDEWESSYNVWESPMVNEGVWERLQYLPPYLDGSVTISNISSRWIQDMELTKQALEKATQNEGLCYDER